MFGTKNTLEKELLFDRDSLSGPANNEKRQPLLRLPFLWR
jgi:hypothetical protein